MLERRKVVLVGTGFVGMSMAYSLVNQGGVNELVLVDILKDKAEGEAMDLAHGMPFAPSRMDIKSGDYSECKDANIVVITAGLNQKPNQTRLELAIDNAKIIKDITKQVVESGFKGIFVVASNPVDLMTYVVYKTSGFPKEKVIGSGTVLDSSRLRYLIGEYLENTQLDTWVKFISNVGDIDMSKADESIKKAKEVLEEISLDERESYLAHLRLKYILDQKNIEETGFERGFERGLKEGLEQGLQEKIKIAKNMLNKNIDISIISEVTGLTKKEVENL